MPEIPSEHQAPRRFGEAAVEMGFCTPQQVADALAVQAGERARGGGCRLIGEVLYYSDVLGRTQVDAIVARLAKSMPPVGAPAS